MTYRYANNVTTGIPLFNTLTESTGVFIGLIAPTQLSCNYDDIVVSCCNMQRFLHVMCSCWPIEGGGGGRWGGGGVKGVGVGGGGGRGAGPLAFPSKYALI